ncbi:ribosome small subunit-dependent GTPase A [Solicola sp. PLA-1-18]|uniref:ribosome small subunit-dependent GTPase A n=1 Tax=Solicola sp. PLA-1-18 TaxID=3380532 RepID=UPI003B77E2EA
MNDILTSLGWDDSWAATARTLDPDLLPGRLTRVDRGLSTLMTADGPIRAGLGGGPLDATARDSTLGPCVGDWGLVRRWPDQRATLEHLLPRRTCVVRAMASGRSEVQALAANVTSAAAVCGLDQMPSVARVERLVALAWESGAQPVVVLTKADLAADADDVAADVLAEVPGVEVVVCSVEDGRGLDALRARAASGTLALLGSSGAGKSSLANALVGADVLLTRGIRSDGRGRHTSVRRELVLLPGGGAVVDTPGLRQVGLGSGAEGVAATFADVEELVASCRFADCGHAGEPGCAVRAALDDGSLTVRRYDSWRALQREAAYMARRSDARLRAAELKVWKQRTREHRGAARRR